MTQPLTADSTVHPGDTVYTVVTFSEPVAHTVAGDEAARPALFIVIDGMAERYRMLPHGVGFQSGEAKPLHDGTDDYLCKYTIPADTVGTLVLQVGPETTDRIGNPIAETTAHTALFVVETKPESPMMLEPVETPDDPVEPELIDTLDWLIPPPNTVLSENEQALISNDIFHGRDGSAPTLQTQAGKAVDRISLLPYKDREEVYAQFVATVNLPFFAEAAEALKEINIQLRTLDEEAGRTGDRKAYDQFRQSSNAKLGITEWGKRYTLARIYFEENPQDVPHQDGHSFYWIILEYYRLQLEHPNLTTIRERSGQEPLLNLYRQSAKKGYILGLDNPWD